MRLNTSFLRAVAYLTVLALTGCGDEEPSDSDMAMDESRSDDKDAAATSNDSGMGKPSGNTKDSGGSTSGSDAATKPDPGTGGRSDAGRDASSKPTASDAGTGGRSDSSTPATPSGDGGAGLADLESLRQLCVDEVNMYRAMLSLPPLARLADQEACSDEGAKLDGDTGKAHGSAGKCKGLGGQNTCPGWGVGPRTGNATVADALKRCLKQMWDEAEPPVSRMECQADYEGCFLKHGHYLNMSDTRYKKIACGFYQMSNGKYWMNQNFGF
jgi:hypothetical protein